MMLPGFALFAVTGLVQLAMAVFALVYLSRAAKAHERVAGALERLAGAQERLPVPLPPDPRP